MWASAPTEWFLAVIYVIMVKNTVTRLIFRRKAGETAPQRGAWLSKRTQRNEVERFFDRLKKHPSGCFFSVLSHIFHQEGSLCVI